MPELSFLLSQTQSMHVVALCPSSCHTPVFSRNG